MSSPTLPSTSLITPEIRQRLDLIREHIHAGRAEQAGYNLSKLPQPLNSDPEVIIIGALFEQLAGRPDSALSCARLAYSMRLNDPNIVIEYGALLWRNNKKSEAISILHGHHEKHPSHVGVVRMLAEFYRLAGMTPHANAMADKVALLEPETIESLFVRAYRNTDLRRYAVALELFAKAAELAPADPRSGGGRMLPMLYAGAPAGEIRTVAERWCKHAYGDLPRAQLPVRPRHGRKLRIGYVSGDFKEHVVPFFFEGICRNHDRSHVTVVGYSNVEKRDNVTERFASTFDLWRDIRNLSDEALAELIRADDIDVLVDLSGHTASNRLGAFARRAAPVQATYLGYPATTGLAEMDYRITDAWADPIGVTDMYCTEKLFRLPRCGWAFSIPPERDAGLDLKVPGPAGKGLPFTFASFNLLTKVDQTSTHLWGRVLARCGDKAKLLMTDRQGLLGNPEGVQILTDEFIAAGANPTNIMLASWLPSPTDQARRLAQADLMLDPRTYNGTTTTAEALWYGVPSITLPGTSHVSRVGVSLLTAMGLENLITSSEEEFIAKAHALVEDPSFLIQIRPTMRDRLKASPLGDHISLCKAMEDAYETMLDEKSRNL